MIPVRRKSSGDTKSKVFSVKRAYGFFICFKGGELCVNDLEEIIDSSQPIASRHLAYLRRAEPSVTRKDRLWI